MHLDKIRSSRHGGLLAIALGKRKPVQQPLFITVADLNVRAHPFYEAVNKVLDAHHFDTFAEGLCAEFYDDGERGGRPGLAPGIYFRCLLAGYFEGIDSERGIDWRCNDSLSLKAFLGIPCDQPAPDHSTISRTRRLIDLETHAAVFQEVLKQPVAELSFRLRPRGAPPGADQWADEALRSSRSTAPAHRRTSGTTSGTL